MEEKKSFRIDPLGTVLHNEKTREIFSRLHVWEKSKFVRRSIVRYAEREGYNSKIHKKKPTFLNDSQWKVYQKRNEKSKIVDYSYYLAFYWLKSLSKFSYIKDGEFLRLIIEDSEDFIIDYLLQSEVVPWPF